MSVSPESTLADPEQVIADLQRQPAECEGERDEVPKRETGTAEVLQVINSYTGDLAPVFTIRLPPSRHGYKGCLGRSPLGNAERSGRRVGRIWIHWLSSRIMALPQLPWLAVLQKGTRFV
jgi:hypothetical protein